MQPLLVRKSPRVLLRAQPCSGPARPRGRHRESAVIAPREWIFVPGQPERLLQARMPTVSTRRNATFAEGSDTGSCSARQSLCVLRRGRALGGVLSASPTPHDTTRSESHPPGVLFTYVAQPDRLHPRPLRDDRSLVTLLDFDGGSVPDNQAYWAWRDLLLMHPDGRAKGREPCVKCGAPVPQTRTGRTATGTWAAHAATAT